MKVLVWLFCLLSLSMALPANKHSPHIRQRRSPANAIGQDLLGGLISLRDKDPPQDFETTLPIDHLNYAPPASSRRNQGVATTSGVTGRQFFPVGFASFSGAKSGATGSGAGNSAAAPATSANSGSSAHSGSSNSGSSPANSGTTANASGRPTGANTAFNRLGAGFKRPGFDVTNTIDTHEDRRDHLLGLVL